MTHATLKSRDMRLTQNFDAGPAGSSGLATQAAEGATSQRISFKALHFTPRPGGQFFVGLSLASKDGHLYVGTAEGPDGKIVARALLRLLWDGEQPVLFLDRFYPNNLDPKQAQAITDLALKKAEKLGCPLLSTAQGGGGEPYPKTLLALGGSAPFEYVDAVGGIRVQGRFQIAGATILGGTS